MGSICDRKAEMKSPYNLLCGCVLGKCVRGRPKIGRFGGFQTQKPGMALRLTCRLSRLNEGPPRVLLPLLCFNSADQRAWPKTAPHEYPKSSGIDILEIDQRSLMFYPIWTRNAPYKRTIRKWHKRVKKLLSNGSKNCYQTHQHGSPPYKRAIRKWL